MANHTTPPRSSPTPVFGANGLLNPTVVICIVVIVFLVFLARADVNQGIGIYLGELADMIDDPTERQNIESIVVTTFDDNVIIRMVDGTVYRTDKDRNGSLTSQLRTLGVSDSAIEAVRAGIRVDNNPSPNFVKLLTDFAPIVLVLGMIVWWVRRGGIKVTNTVEQVKRAPVIEQKAFHAFTFADIVGLEVEKSAFADVIALLRQPSTLKNNNIRLPSGVLITGAPGTGKTILARAVAGEARATLFETHGADFVELFTGVGTSRVRNLFERARSAAPSVIILNDIDALAGLRIPLHQVRDDERVQTMTQLFTELDRTTENAQILMIATTNRPDLLDPALVRSGRLERRVHVGLPDAPTREALLRKFTQGKTLGADVDLKTWAASTEGMTGAGLEQLINEAGLRVFADKRSAITANDLAASLQAMQGNAP